MNIFSKLAAREHETDHCLGNPLFDESAFRRRIHAMAALTGGNGFRQYPKGPKLSKGGMTRRERIAAGTFRPRLIKVRP